MINVGAVLERLDSSGLLASRVERTEVTITGITDDSREVEPGHLFCAIRGHDADGHRFLPQAEAAGAAAALVEQERSDLGFPQYRVKDGRRAAAIAAQVVYGDPAVTLSLIGVTGTNGKTTTVYITRHVLSSVRRAGSIGTLGTILPSGERRAAGLTTPGPVEFASVLAELRDAGARYVVAEVSSHALVQHRVDGAAFEVAVFTNLTRDHLDYHTSLEDYRRVKLRLIDLVRPEGIVLMNADEPAWSGAAANRHTLTYGLAASAEYRAVNVELGSEGSSWTWRTPEGEVAIALPLLGEFNVSNALAAASAAHALGMEPREIADALRAMPPVPGRLEVLWREPLVLRDYAHTPDALRRALQALRPAVAGRLIVVFGCGGDRDRGKRPLMGRAAAEGADLAIVTSDNPRRESPEAIIDEVMPGIGSAPHERIVDRRTAIARAIEIAGPADAVLLAGKGHETYQVVGTERRPFDEAVIVNETLGSARSGS